MFILIIRFFILFFHCVKSKFLLTGIFLLCFKIGLPVLCILKCNYCFVSFYFNHLFLTNKIIWLTPSLFLYFQWNFTLGTFVFKLFKLNLYFVSAQLLFKKQKKKVGGVKIHAKKFRLLHCTWSRFIHEYIWYFEK